jgi:hypothetical protein
MSWVDEQLSAQFLQWEQRGRGWTVWPAPVVLEPPFRPFPGHVIREFNVTDDGRRPTVVSSFVQRLAQRLSSEPPPLPPKREGPEPEPRPELLERTNLAELQVLLPAKLDASRDVFAHFLRTLSHCREPIGFELIGLPDKIINQFVTHPTDLPTLQRQLQGHFPEAVFIPQDGTLARAWQAIQEGDTAVVEFGLAREFMFRLAVSDQDSLVGLTAALADLKPGELGLFQVLFGLAQHPWTENVLRAVSDGQGKPAFVNAPELLDQGERKVALPLFAAVVRAAARTEEVGRAWEIVRDLAAVLANFADPRSNELIPLSNEQYPFDDHAADVRRRQSRRTGMLLNLDELVGFVHLPSADVRTPKLQRERRKTKRAPALAAGPRAVLLGTNEHAGQSLPVYLSPEQRVRHTHIIGASGTGKSTLLFNLIRQDIEAGEGVAVLDPHGDLVERLLGIIPHHRVHDVVLVDPADEEFCIGFNILSAHSDLEKNLLASDLVSVFERLSASWGDQMGSVLHNAILAFLESSEGGTLAHLRRFLLEPAYRARFLRTVRDAELLYYWQRGFPQLSGNRSIGPVLTRLETFLSPKPIRYMVSQRENRLNFAAIMNERKILLVKLAQGALGKENSYLLGTLFVAKLQQTVMSRQQMRESERADFWCYLDEFHNFITPSMAEILTGARKYRLGLVLAHQELRQLQRSAEVASAVLSNPCTRIVFRVGDADARTLESGFASFEARDLQNLGIGEAIARIERSDFDFNLAVSLPQEPDPEQAAATRRQVVTASREKYARPRAEVEAALRAEFDQAEAVPEQPEPKPSLPRFRKASETKPSETSAPVVEKEPPASAAEEPVVREPKPPRDLGRGGEQHKAIRERLQTEAQALGFLTEVEGRVEEQSLEAADLVLRKGDLAIAVEITITTTVDHEFGNVKKCLKAGFKHMAVVSPQAERLKAIAGAVHAGLGSEEAAKVSYHTPDEFITHLRNLAAEERAKSAPPTLPNERISRGRTIRRHGPKLTAEEQKAKEAAAIRMIAKTMKGSNHSRF